MFLLILFGVSGCIKDVTCVSERYSWFKLDKNGLNLFKVVSDEKQIIFLQIDSKYFERFLNAQNRSH